MHWMNSTDYWRSAWSLMKMLDKQEIRDLKNRTVSELTKLDIDFSLCSKVDERLTCYIKECISSPERHNLYELLAIKRFWAMCQKYELRPLEVRKTIVVYEYLKFPSDKGAKSFKLTPVQVFQFTNIEGFYYHDTNRRVITEALLFVPRKFSKTTSVASFAVKDLLFGDANAQAYVAANSYDQAHICFEVIQFVLKQLDPKMVRFKVNREQVYNLSKGKTSFARCLSADASKLDGLNASTVIVDEYAQADSAALKNVLTSSMGVRVNPLTIIITTASDKRDTPFTELLDAYKSILRGEMDLDCVFAHIFEPDVDDEEGDVNTWYKVQPHLGITCREEFYHDSWAKAQTSSENMKEFRNKLLNIFAVDAKKEWITKAQIEQRELFLSDDELRNYPTVCSVDLSVCDDFSAVTYLIYTPGRFINRTQKVCNFHSITQYYFPKGQLEKHPNREMYTRWAEKGYLSLLDGDVIDYERIVNDILSKPFRILGIGYDPYKSLEFIKRLECTPNIGKEYLYAVPQTYGAFTSPVESFEIALHTDNITFDTNPITAYCFSNAVIDEDRLENRKPIKSTPNDKIDGAITNIMGFWMLNNVKTIS